MSQMHLSSAVTTPAPLADLPGPASLGFPDCLDEMVGFIINVPQNRVRRVNTNEESRTPSAK